MLDEPRHVAEHALVGRRVEVLQAHRDALVGVVAVEWVAARVVVVTAFAEPYGKVDSRVVALAVFGFFVDHQLLELLCLRGEEYVVDLER